MQNYRERLYNHEVTPPLEIWDKISAELDAGNSNILPRPGLRRRSRVIFYGLTAAASLIIIFISSVLFNKPGGNKDPEASLPAATPDHLTQKMKDSLNLNNKTLEAIIRSSKDKNLVASNSDNPSSNAKRYITIEGPEGQPVKISSKAATLIESADNEYPPKPVWNKKIEKWKQIMLTTTISLTSTSLLDIAQLSASIDNNE